MGAGCPRSFHAVTPQMKEGTLFSVLPQDLIGCLFAYYPYPALKDTTYESHNYWPRVPQARLGGAEVMYIIIHPTTEEIFVSVFAGNGYIQVLEPTKGTKLRTFEFDDLPRSLVFRGVVTACGAMLFDKNSNLVVVGREETDALHCFDPADGRKIRSLEGKFDKIQAICATREGNIAVVDYHDERVQIQLLSPEGEVLKFIRDGWIQLSTKGDGVFGIATDPRDGKLFLSEYEIPLGYLGFRSVPENHTGRYGIHVFSADGKYVSTIDRHGQPPGPGSLLVDGSGKIIVGCTTPGDWGRKTFKFITKEGKLIQESRSWTHEHENRSFKNFVVDGQGRLLMVDGRGEVIIFESSALYPKKLYYG